MEKWQKAEGISTDNTRQKSQGRQNKVLVGLYGKIAELAIILKLFIHSINNENIRELFIITETFFKKECLLCFQMNPACYLSPKRHRGFLNLKML